MSAKLQVAIIGAGNWGTVVAKLVAESVSKSTQFSPTVSLWAHQELVGGVPLTDIINNTHINVKYLPGVVLPKNIKAEPSLETAITGANLLVFVVS